MSTSTCAPGPGAPTGMSQTRPAGTFVNVCLFGGQAVVKPEWYTPAFDQRVWYLFLSGQPLVYCAGSGSLGPGKLVAEVLGIEGNSAAWHFSVGWTALISEKRIVFEVPSVNWAMLRAVFTEKAARDGEPAPEPIFEVGVSGQLKTYQSPTAGA